MHRQLFFALSLALVSVPVAAQVAPPAARDTARALDTTRTTARKMRPGREVLTVEQMLEGHFENAFDAVSALRPAWLSTRGTTTFSVGENIDQVLVYEDNVKLGGIETLRTVSPRTILGLRHLDGPAAQARFGVGHGAGVIQIESVSRTSAGVPQ